ncbi:hypothetical protein [Aeromicrobium sp. 179-A 4D2 NHS]|uniref:hypothetical protein n=1 Tax=Aeromicrobium sp. 179-A 4D2 NHS TaxID=3142375 RepID=UPI0039A3C8C7
MTAVKTADADHADYALHRDGRLVGHIEIKTRTNRHDAYPTYMLSLAKLDHLHRRAIITGVPSAVVVQWTDRLAMIDATIFRDKAVMRSGGRWDRGDALDVEKVAHIGIDQFIFLT